MLNKKQTIVEKNNGIMNDKFKRIFFLNIQFFY